jgi:hypothetical protein
LQDVHAVMLWVIVGLMKETDDNSSSRAAAAAAAGLWLCKKVSTGSFVV